MGRTEEVILPREQAEVIWAHEREVIESGRPRTNIVWSVEYNGKQLWLLIDLFPSYDAQGTINGTIGCGMDITALKKSQEALMVGYRQERRLRREQEELVEQLQARVAVTREPESPLQICPVCKNIRDEGGRYIALESYFKDHLGVEFSPGFCPECAEKVHREIQPQKPTCQECGSDLDVMRYTVGGRHFRRYSCPICGHTRDFVRERREKAG